MTYRRNKYDGLTVEYQTLRERPQVLHIAAYFKLKAKDRYKDTDWKDLKNWLLERAKEQADDYGKNIVVVEVPSGKTKGLQSVKEHIVTVNMSILTKDTLDVDEDMMMMREELAVRYGFSC